MIPHSASSAFHSYMPQLQTELLSSCFSRGGCPLLAALQTQGNQGNSACMLQGALAES